MCKLFAIVEVENQKNAEMFTKVAIPAVTKTDNHGMGIMRLGENGVHSQRWLVPPKVIRKKESKKMLKYQKALMHEHNETGKPSKSLYAIAVHGRYATCEKTIENTHPFVKDGTSLMHNGVISNASAFERTLSTCDSEALLTQYLATNVKENAVNLTKSLEGVSGYYATIVFNDNGTIDIWRDDTATLFLAHVRDVGVVIATTAEIITYAAKVCKATLTGIDEIVPYTAIRWTKGLYPQISKFEGKEPELTQTYTLENGFLPNSKVIDYNPDYFHHEIEASPDSYEKHWWNIENEIDREAARVKDWEDQDKADAEELREWYEGTNRKAAMRLRGKGRGVL